MQSKTKNFKKYTISIPTLCLQYEQLKPKQLEDSKIKFFNSGIVKLERNKVANEALKRKKKNTWRKGGRRDQGNFFRDDSSLKLAIPAFSIACSFESPKIALQELVRSSSGEYFLKGVIFERFLF